MGKRVKFKQGYTVNYLTVIRELSERDKSGGVLFLCSCVCGNKRKVSASSLKYKSTKSCGCKDGESKVVNLIGQRFGRLLVVERMKKRHQRSILWKCLCDCGNYIETINLRNGGARSCGCLRNEMLATMSKTNHSQLGTGKYPARMTRTKEYAIWNAIKSDAGKSGAASKWGKL